MSCLSSISLMASLDILCFNHFNLKNKIMKIEHQKMFCDPSKILKNISWPINICLKFFMTPTKTLVLLTIINRVCGCCIYLSFFKIFVTSYFSERLHEKLVIDNRDTRGKYKTNFTPYEDPFFISNSIFKLF